jgi:hypothetical protein
VFCTAVSELLICSQLLLRALSVLL